MTRAHSRHAVPRDYWGRILGGCSLFAGLSLMAASCGQGSADTDANVETDGWHVAAARVSLEYPAETECRTQGLEEYTLAWNPRDTKGVLSGPSGEPIVVRDKGIVRVRPGVNDGSPAQWYEMASGTPEFDFFAMTSEGYWAVEVLGDLEGPLSGLEMAAETHPAATPVALNESSNAPDTFTWYGEGRVDSFTLGFPSATFPNEMSRTYSLLPQDFADVYGSAASMAVDPLPYGGSSASDALLLSPHWDKNCYDEDADFVDRDRACIAEVVGDRSIEDWMSERSPDEWFTPHECPSG